MKRILSIQDLSCIGRCSLSLALPVLSAMGCQCVALPTAVLSAHTAFPNPHIRDLTADIDMIRGHFMEIGASFDAIQIGYLSSPAQAEAAARILQSFPATAVIDPAMGDNGRLYSGITTAHLDAVRELCRRADFLLPNVTEAAMLAGFPYTPVQKQDDLSFLLDRLSLSGEKTVVLTGVDRPDGSTGFEMLARGGARFSYRTSRIDKRCHGTGDLFAAVFTGAVAMGAAPQEAAVRGARFVETVLADAADGDAFGIPFENHLTMLFPD